MTSPKPQETPRTDAALERFAEEGAFAIFPLMRQLERELSAALEQNERLERERESDRIVRRAWDMAWRGDCGHTWLKEESEKCQICEAARLREQLAAARARIDALMLEYCPDEMTAEQVAEWGRHQRPVSPEQNAAIAPARGEGK